MKATQKKALGSEKIIVIGTSAGGLRALSFLASQLPASFPCPILVVQHISPDASGNALLDAIQAAGPLNCIHAVNGAAAKAGHIYLAPSDHHMVVTANGRFKITRGAQENRSRPAIDPLFRSAAVSYGTKSIAILLTGYLDDGVSGMMAVRDCGGICIIQEPSDADYPDMPNNALAQLRPDHLLPIAQMGALLVKLTEARPPSKRSVPEAIKREAKIAERVLSDLGSVNSLGNQVPFNCPGCGGVLWKVGKNKGLRYRCHVGHAYTAASLLADQTQKIEETMWAALRMFEERRNLLTTIAADQTGKTAEASLERAAMSQVHIDRIRAVIFSDDKPSTSDQPK